MSVWKIKVKPKNFPTVYQTVNKFSTSYTLTQIQKHYFFILLLLLFFLITVDAA